MRVSILDLSRAGNFALVNCRLGDTAGSVELRNVGAWRGRAGLIRIKAPRITTRKGADLGAAWRLRRQVRLAVVEAIAASWEAALAADRERHGTVAAPASQPDPTARARLWRDGPVTVAELAGVDAARAKGIVGRFVKHAGGHCGAVARALDAARDKRPDDPLQWIFAAISAELRQAGPA
jgi:hypothetical protein